MSKNEKISLRVIQRLPKYFRYVNKMKQNGIATVSSSELAAIMGTTASQVRQDFNCFGGFGQQGIGYNVELLSGELKKLLLGGDSLTTILIGTGRLGRAVSHFLANEAPGYRLIGVFDKKSGSAGDTVEGHTVRDISELEEFCKNNTPTVAVLCVPEEGARSLSQQLFELGISGFWNFSHYDLSSDNPCVIVENVHLGDSLMSLGYRVRNNDCE